MTDTSPAVLGAVEARILGGLIEKQATTPESYPLTANAVQLACNQKNNREPVLELEAGEVGHALREMEAKGLVRSVHGARAQRYEHRFATVFSVTAKQQALLAVLMLRGPQTLAEMHARGERMGGSTDADELQHTVERLLQRAPALLVNLGRVAGQREDRYMHLLCGPVVASDYAAAAADEAATPAKRAGLEARVEALEAEVAALRRQLDGLQGQGDRA